MGTAEPLAAGGGQALVGRQPILDGEGAVFGYELLFRTPSGARGEVEGRKATAQVTAHALNTIGMERLVGGKKAFINVDADFLMDDVITAIPRERFILEILETVEVDDRVVRRVARLREMGYTIAIDDLDLGEEQTANFEPLFPVTIHLPQQPRHRKC